MKTKGLWASVLIGVCFITAGLQASVNVTVNGVTYPIPQTNEKGWGTTLTNWIQAISQNSLQPVGGTFTLANDVDFGGSKGLKSAYFSTRSLNPASAGLYRLSVGDSIGWRNNANSADLLLSVNGSDQLTFNGAIFPQLSSAAFTDSGFTIVNAGDSSKKIAFQASGITTATTRTLSAPDASGTLVLSDNTATLTNKTISGSSNTLTNISLTTAVTGTLPASSGGTGQTSTTAAFNALSPNTTKGDITAYSTTNARLGVGSDGQVLTADSAQTPGIKWATPASAPSASYEASNCSIATSVAANALTIALKDSSGSDPSAGSACKIGFRSSTSATGTYTQRSVTGALSMTVSSGSTLGTSSATDAYLNVYLIDNAGTVVLGVINGLVDEGSVQSSTAEGGAGAAGSANTIYSTAAQTSKAVRLIGRLKVNEATAGTWASNATELSNLPFKPRIGPSVQKFLSGSGTYTTPSGVKYIRVRMVGGGAGGSGSGTTAGVGVNGTGGGNTTFGTTLLVANGGSAGSMPGSGGAGGTASLGTGPVGVALSGTTGTGYADLPATSTYIQGGAGGGTPFGGGGGGGTANTAAVAAASNTGAGGGGAGGGSAVGMRSGIGGGAGGFVDAIIVNPSATYSYAVGAAGGGGSAGTSGFAGAAGSLGLILVEEYY